MAGTETTLELHVVRETDAGTVYEDVVAHLSESEREVVGAVVALAGYLAHEGYEGVPLILLYSLGAIDADLIDDLVENFRRLCAISRGRAPPRGCGGAPGRLRAAHRQHPRCRTTRRYRARIREPYVVARV